jgi:hypothetical protein
LFSRNAEKYAPKKDCNRMKICASIHSRDTPIAPGLSFNAIFLYHKDDAPAGLAANPTKPPTKETENGRYNKED